MGKTYQRGALNSKQIFLTIFNVCVLEERIFSCSNANVGDYNHVYNSLPASIALEQQDPYRVQGRMWNFHWLQHEIQRYEWWSQKGTQRHGNNPVWGSMLVFFINMPENSKCMSSHQH